MKTATARLVAAALLLATALGGEDGKRTLDATDVGRIRELHHLTDTFGSELWPGFDARQIPIAVNHDDRQEMLIGHPRPPAAFRVFQGHAIDGKPVMIRDGCTRYGPKRGGWATDVGGEHCAYVSTLQPGQTTESYLSLLLHECFHVYQRRYRARGEGRWGEPPTDDPTYAALIGLESRVLHAALEETADEKARALMRMFVAVRHARRADLDAGIVRAEGEEEYSEGTATYIQARLMQLLAQAGGVQPASGSRDPHYHGFRRAAAEYQRFVRQVLPPPGSPISFFHAQYNLGMAQCLLLDRFRPGWKEEMRSKGMTQFTLVERQFPMADEVQKGLLAEAKERFRYADLEAEQKRLVDKRLAKIRGYLDAKGRRYRVYHGALGGGFRWKPRGPVYRVPASLMRAPGGATVWAGGMHFEKAGLVLDSHNVPVLFRHDYLEWIDRDPAADGSDLAIKSDRCEAGIHHGLRVETDGFVLTVPRARVETSKDVVAIRPLPGD